MNETDFEFKNGCWTRLSENESKSRQLTIQNAVRSEEIMRELDALDRKRVRAIAEPALKDENITWLEFYNSKISELRQELASIS